MPQAFSLLLFRASKNIKNGTPVRAVITPMGTASDGDSRRDIKSEATSRFAPAIALKGSNFLFSAPHSMRIIWGTTSPTKPITPLIATHAAVAAEAAKAVAYQRRFTFTPLLKACSAPNDIKSSPLWDKSKIIQEGIAKHAQRIIPFQSAASSEPRDQNTKLFRPPSRALYMQYPTKAPQNAFTAMPANSIDRAFSRPSSLPRIHTAANADRPHASAPICIPQNGNPNVIASTAPRAAPEDTPVIDGSARGFLKIPCIPAPAMAKEAPVSIANTSRGSLNCVMINDAC